MKAARLEEFSAQERLEDHTEAVRQRRPPGPVAGGPRVPKQGVILAVVTLLAFIAAIYLGSDNPYDSGAPAVVEPPSGVVVPLAPEAEVPGSGDVANLYAASRASGFGRGAGGLTLPDPTATEHFSGEQVLTALSLAKEYVVASALTADVLTGHTSAPVRLLLGPQQQEQFDRAMVGGGADSVASDWLVRLNADPDAPTVALADPLPRVDGSFSYDEVADEVLRVTGRHVVVYAVRPADQPDAPATLFTVEREVRLSFGDAALRDRQPVVHRVDVLAGPMDCAAETDAALEPLLAGERAAHQPASRATDPYAATASAAAATCGVLAPDALPSLPGRG